MMNNADVIFITEAPQHLTAAQGTLGHPEWRINPRLQRGTNLLVFVLLAT